MTSVIQEGKGSKADKSKVEQAISPTSTGGNKVVMRNGSKYGNAGRSGIKSKEVSTPDSLDGKPARVGSTVVR